MLGWLYACAGGARVSRGASRREGEGGGGDAREVRLDLDLAADLLLDLVLDDLLLVEALEGDNVLGLGLCARHVDAAKLALAEGLADLERRERERDRRAVAVRA